MLLDERAVIDKVVRRRRGGFCYELNGAFALLLTELGFDVALLAARVFGPDGLGPPFDHLVLRVTVAPDSRSWLVDVGFGDHSTYPLAYDERSPQPDPSGSFRLEDTGEGDVDVFRGGVRQYRVEPRPRQWSDFVPLCWWHQTSPASHFTQSLVCSRAVPAGRVTLSDRRLIRTIDGVRTEQILTAEADVLAVYRDLFGIELPAAPHLQVKAGSGPSASIP